MDYRKLAREILDELPAYKPPPVPEKPLTDDAIASKVLIDIHRRLLDYTYGTTPAFEPTEAQCLRHDRPVEP